MLARGKCWLAGRTGVEKGEQSFQGPSVARDISMATDFLAVFRAFQGFSRSETVAIRVQKKEQDQSKMTMKTKSRLDQFFIEYRPPKIAKKHSNGSLRKRFR